MIANETGKDEDVSLFFTDGYVVRRDAVIIPAQFQSEPDTLQSRVLFFLDDQWFFHDFDNANIRSVTHHNGLAYLMGMNGVIHSVGRIGRPFGRDSIPGSYQQTVIGDIKRYGALFRIRFIGERVYACGQSSQVYILASTGWQHADQGILKRGGTTLEDIDGTGPDNIYAVGWNGTIVHYDGNRWTQLDCPTNQHLSNVRCLSRDEVYVCGNAGTILRGNTTRWEILGEPDPATNFWGMTIFDGTLYLAHNLGLVKLVDDKVEPIEVDIGRSLTCHRLHGADGVLWSFGESELLRFDGESWKEIVCPENL